MTDLKVDYIDSNGKYASVEINGERVLELVVVHDMNARSAVSKILRNELHIPNLGIIGIKRVDA